MPRYRFFFGWEGSPKTDFLKKVGTLVLTSLLEDVAQNGGVPLLLGFQLQSRFLLVSSHKSGFFWFPQSKHHPKRVPNKRTHPDEQNMRRSAAGMDEPTMKKL